jgi:hypothetical protein
MPVLRLASCRLDAQDYVGATDISSNGLELRVAAFQLEVTHRFTKIVRICSVLTYCLR